MISAPIVHQKAFQHASHQLLLHAPAPEAAGWLEGAPTEACPAWPATAEVGAAWDAGFLNTLGSTERAASCCSASTKGLAGLPACSDSGSGYGTAHEGQ